MTRISPVDAGVDVQRRRWRWLALILGVQALCASAAVAHNGAVALVPPVTGLILDGDLTDWPVDITEHAITHVEFGDDPADAEDMSAWLRLAHDPASNELFIGIRVRDQSFVSDPEDPNRWNTQDGCEIYLDFGHGVEVSTVVQHAFYGDHGDRSSGSEVSHRLLRTSSGYQVEWRVALPPMDVDSTGALAPRSIGFDLSLGDYDADGSYSWVAWGPGPTKLTSVTRRGDLVLLADSTPSGRIHGRLVWSEAGAITGVNVPFHSLDSDGLWTQVQTDTAGAYSVTLPPGRYQVQLLGQVAQVELSPGGVVDHSLTAPPPMGQEQPLGAGQTVDLGSGTWRQDWQLLSVHDGLPDNSISALHQTSDGILWIGTLGGHLAAFDGERITAYHEADGVPAGSIRALASGPRGSLWVGTTDGGLARVQRRRVTRYTEADGLPGAAILSMVVVEDVLWIGTAEGLVRFDGLSFQTFVESDGLPASHITVLEASKANGLWVGTFGGLAHLDGASIRHFGASEGLADKRITTLQTDASGTLWVGTARGEMYRLAGDRFVDVSGISGLGAEGIRSIQIDDQGRRWLATASGIHLDEDEEHPDDLTMLQDVSINNMLIDQEGTLWAATQDEGLARYDMGRLRNWDAGIDLPEAEIRTLLRQRDGTLWAGTDGQGLVRLKQGEISVFTTADGLPSDYIRYLLQADDGTVWVATPEGVATLRESRFRRLKTPAGLSRNTWQLMQDPSGGIWIATIGGVARFADGDFRFFSTEDGLLSTDVRCMLADRKGGIWLGTPYGLSRLRDGEFTAYTVADGLVDNDIRTLLQGSDGEIWVGTATGLSRFDGHAFTTLRTDLGFARHSVFTLLEDRTGVLWIGSTSGVSRYDGDVLQFLTPRDGLITRNAYAMTDDSDGRVWVGGRGGLSRYKPRQTQPGIELVNVTTDRPLGPLTQVEIPSTQSFLTVEIRGISLKTRPRGMLYRYRLVGTGTPWQTTRDRRLEFSDLPTGDCVLEIEAIDRDLNRSPRPLQLSILVHPPYGQIALWAGLGLALMGLLVAGVVILRKSRQSQQQESRFRGLLELAPDAVVVVGEDGCITLVNAQAERMFGYSRHEMLDQPIELLVPERFREAHVGHRSGFLKHVKTGQDAVELSLIGRRKSGGEFPIEIGLSALTTDEATFAFANVRDVTERRLAEQSLTAAEERSRLLLESVGESIIGVDEEGCITFVNPAAEHLLGYAERELLQRSVHTTLLHSFQDGSEVSEQDCFVLQACRQGVGGRGEDEAIWRKDGKSVSIDCTVTPVYQDEAIMGAVFSFRDITQRKRADEALKKQAEELHEIGRQREARAVQESSLSDLARAIQGDLTVAAVSAVSLERIGVFLEAPVGAVYVLEADDQLHRTAGRALPPEAESWTQFAVGSGSVGQAALTARPSIFEIPDGSSPVSYGFGRLGARQMVTHPLVANDILVGVVELCVTAPLDEAKQHWLNTACRIAASALRMSQQAQERTAAEERTRLILQSTGDGLFGLDREGRTTFVNPAACDMLGYTTDDLIGKSLHERVYHSHADRSPRAIADSPVNRAFREGEVVTVVDDVLWRRDGTLLPVEYTATPIRKAEEVVGAVVSFRDIAERQAAERAMREARDLAEAAARTKADFLSNMSHEIRTPMNAVIGMAHLALRTDLDPRQRDYLEKIQSSGQHLLGIINDILDFSKIEAGKLEVEHVDFDLDQVLDNVATLVGDKATAKGLEFLFDVDPALRIRLQGDPLRLGQVLINYANNAVKFTQTGQIVVRARPLKEVDGDLLVRFEVQDSGIGLTQDQIGRLFRSFQQADASTTREYGGTGLGLAIARQLAELMGGEVGVDSEPGQGSTFWFSARLRRSQEAPRQLIPEHDLRDRRVLVVDDSPLAREVLSSMLASMSFRADRVASGEEALDEVARADDVEDPFDLVFMDWHMPPGMDGIEAARRLGALSLRSQPGVILVTAHGREEVFREAGEAGIELSLMKPVNPSILFDTAVRALGGTEAADAAAGSRDESQDTAALKGARVLLVEDNLLNQQVANELLTAAGFQVEVAENGEVAVASVDKAAFDAVLMDMHMPVMDGETATRRIRADKRFADLPILAMTANAMEGDRERCLQAGMNDHIPKPIDPDVLFSTLRRWILTSRSPVGA